LATWLPVDHFEAERFTSGNIFPSPLISPPKAPIVHKSQWQSERQQQRRLHNDRLTQIGLKEAVKGPFFGQDICPNIYTQAGRDTNADTKSRSIPAVRLILAAFDVLSTHKLPGTGFIPLSTILRALFMGQAKI